jgi:hypothetical protein
MLKSQAFLDYCGLSSNGGASGSSKEGWEASSEGLRGISGVSPEPSDKISAGLGAIIPATLSTVFDF